MSSGILFMLLAPQKACSSVYVCIQTPKLLLTPSHHFQEKDTREQQELNELADSDPAEYDRRIKAWHKRKIEGRDGTSSSLNAGDDGDGVDQTQNGDLERRKALARERRDAR